MKILLDEMMPVEFRHDLKPHEVLTVSFMNWKGKTNGDLLASAVAENFDAMITNDRNMQFQQSKTALPFPVLVTRVPQADHALLRKLVPEILRLLSEPLSKDFHLVN